ncbi:hypothetical protein Slin15195_G122170 [Septoria linicola]|uniref:Uncharacterized protein n=1 Tax=Septoria linicola TaxID=215465 RepID=A0A9Q9B4P5_9PEZI|nr:hypothetical protein Slin14017_G078380 [Septoria linicola]USW58898.1 hypothetical protein Slin15195_G122170 [Septoria linicola]
MKRPSASPARGPEAFKPRMSSTSLNLLLPNVDRSTQHFHFATPDTALTQELARLTGIGIKLYNERRFMELAQSGLISPDLIKINQDGAVKNDNFDGHMTDHKTVVQDSPDFQSRVLDIVVDADERKGLGTTYTLLEVTGYPSTLCRQTISVVKWKRN